MTNDENFYSCDSIGDGFEDRFEDDTVANIKIVKKVIQY